jgi:biotin carboxyl carrier protein
VAEWQVDRRPDGTWLVTADTGTRHVAHAVTGADDEVWVQVDGDVIVVASASEQRTRPQSHGHATLDAPMPAQVTAVLVAPGDVVEAGATLVLLEAMKMELPLKSPFAGRIEAVHCAVGDRVAPGRILVAVVPREETP